MVNVRGSREVQRVSVVPRTVLVHWVVKETTMIGPGKEDESDIIKRGTNRLRYATMG